jgi:hypothetical protein
MCTEGILYAMASMGLVTFWREGSTWELAPAGAGWVGAHLKNKGKEIIFPWWGKDGRSESSMAWNFFLKKSRHRIKYKNTPLEFWAEGSWIFYSIAGANSRI